MFRMASLAAFVAFPLAAQDYPIGAMMGACAGNPDTLTIEDQGEGRAVVTYYNSIEQCSHTDTYDMASESGIQVKVSISIGDKESGYKERITAKPTSLDFMAIPEEANPSDGETVEILIVRPMF